jgi:hypothetical protein
VWFGGTHCWQRQLSVAMETGGAPVAMGTGGGRVAMKTGGGRVAMETHR